MKQYVKKVVTKPIHAIQYTGHNLAAVLAKLPANYKTRTTDPVLQSIEITKYIDDCVVQVNVLSPHMYLLQGVDPEDFYVYPEHVFLDTYEIYIEAKELLDFEAHY